MNDPGGHSTLSRWLDPDPPPPPPFNIPESVPAMERGGEDFMPRNVLCVCQYCFIKLMVYSPCRDKLYLLDSNLTVTGDVLSWPSDSDRLRSCDESFTEEDEVSGCDFKAEWVGLVWRRGGGGGGRGRNEG